MRPHVLPERSREDERACRRILSAGSKSFSLASRLLPKRIRSATTAIYAFCRQADDAIDEPDTDVDGGVRSVRVRLDRVFSNAPADDPVERELVRAVRRHNLPRKPFDALVEGFVWDARGRRYESIRDVEAYAARVASSVGVLVACVMGVRGEAALARACDLGVAMQLTNIARDVAEDAGRRRVYLPLAWLRQTGVDPRRVLAIEYRDTVHDLVRRLLERADELYARADAGIVALPRDCRWSIRAARLVYAEIGRVIERRGPMQILRRAVVPTAKKLWLLVRAAWNVTDSPRLLLLPPLGATRFLVESCEEESHVAR